MKSSSRWLYLFGIAIGVLVIATVVLVLTIGSPSDESLLSEDTPEGTVQRFLLALRDGDYLAAEDYLSPSDDDRTELKFLRNRALDSSESPGWKATLGNTIIKDDEASVGVIIDIFRPRGPFENAVNTQQTTFFLIKEDDSWKITSPVNIWWLY